MKISEQQFRELLDRYLNNTASSTEVEMLDKYFDSYHPAREDSGFVQENNALREEILSGIHSRIEETHITSQRSRFTTLWLPLAAAVSLFVIVYFFADEFGASKKRPKAYSVRAEETFRGEKLVTRLPDGTKVYLNGDSKLSYMENFDDSLREVMLIGEAYFEVVTGEKTFVVHTRDIRTEVHGTSFNVKNRTGKDVEVTLAEGKVNVVTQSGRSSFLKPLQQAVISEDSGEIHTQEVKIARFISWKDNILYFEQTEFKDAVEMIESWYGVKIDIANPSLEGCAITAQYLDEPLGNVLGSLQFLLDLKITRINDGHYTIHGSGCK